MNKKTKTFVLSDTHFGNENIIKYCNRPFTNAEHQTAQFVANWNGKISQEDEVIVCGDFIMGNIGNIPAIMPHLNGHITLVRGNHDTQAKLDLYKDVYADRVTVKDIHYITYKGLFFVFCHFPIIHPEFLDMIRSDNSEIVFVHGHVHDKTPFYTPETNSFNVSVDVISFTPVALEALYETVKQNRSLTRALAFTNERDFTINRADLFN